MVAGYVSDSTDCDDTNIAVYPGAVERCNSRDDDCDSLTDEPDAIDANTYYADTDADSYGDPATATRACSRPSGYVSDNTDCEPAESTAYPGSPAWEHISDGVDQDCDGFDGCEDLDCDGIPDLALPGYYDGDYATTSYVYLGGGGFAEAERLTTDTAGGFWGAAEDLDGDGFKELLLMNYFNGSSYVRTLDIYPGSEDGPNMSVRTSLPANGGWEVVIRDFDDDGDPDLFVVNQLTNSATWAINSPIYWNDAGTFTVGDRTDLPTNGAIDADAADLDADGYTDIIVCNHTNATTRLLNSYVYWGSAAGYSSADRSSLPTQGCRDIGVADFDGDGHLDIAFANFGDDTRHDVLSYIYWGSSTGYSTTNRGTAPTWGATNLDVADANGDGLPDLAFVGFYGSNGTLSQVSYTAVYYSSTAGFSTTARERWDLRGSRDVQFADLNSDGYPELLVARLRDAAGSYETNSMVYWGSAAGYTTSTAIPSTGSYQLLAGDVDADGYPDLISTSSRDNSGYVGVGTLIYWGSAASTYSTADRLELNTVGIGEHSAIIGDATW